VAAAPTLDPLWHDVRLILRGIVGFWSQFSGYRVLGIPADRIGHFLVAAGLLLLAARFMARWKAVVLTAALMALKEVMDVPVKLNLIRGQHTVTVTTDTIWDIAIGLLGLAVAYVIARKLGERWKASARDAHVELLPPAPREELSAGSSRIALVCGVAAAALLVGGFEIAGAVASRSPLLWMPHVVAAVLAVGMFLFLGPGGALLFLMPVLPFADWLHRHVASDRLHVSTTLILTLLCCEAIRRLRRGRGIRLDRPGRMIALYAFCACIIVAINCFRFGWTIERAYWLIPPVTGLAAYVLASEHLADRARLRKALTALAAAFLVVTVIAIIEFRVNPLDLEEVPGSVYGSATSLSPYLTLIWPFLLALALTAGVGRRWITWPAVATGAVVIGLVFVRAGWAAAAAALFLLAAIVAFRRDWALGIATVVVLLTAVIALEWGLRYDARVGYGEPKTRGLQQIASILSPHGYKSARGKEISKGARLVRRSPILGQPDAKVNSLPFAHALTYGVPGTCLAALAVLSVLLSGWAGARRSREPLLRGIAAGAGVGVVAVGLHGLAWSAFLGTSLQPYLWYVLGLVAAAVRATRTGDNTIQKENRE